MHTYYGLKQLLSTLLQFKTIYRAVVNDKYDQDELNVDICLF